MDDLTKKVLIESQALKDAKHVLDSLSNIGGKRLSIFATIEGLVFQP